MSSLIRYGSQVPGNIGPYLSCDSPQDCLISGQLGMDPSSGKLVPRGVEEEAKQALADMDEI
jgi:enamine deaminase RidA (YjgF/YER057c/UK114 family)